MATHSSVQNQQLYVCVYVRVCMCQVYTNTLKHSNKEAQNRIINIKQ